MILGFLTQWQRLGFIIALLVQLSLIGCHPFLTQNTPSPQKLLSASSAKRLNKTEAFWAGLQKDLQLVHYTHRAEVYNQISILMARKHHLQATIKRSAQYIHFIYGQIKKRHLPAELVLLPLIESTYNPLAINHISGACGLWQLTTNTAKGFGIRQDLLFDGRRDIHHSTQAALDFLTYLNQFFAGDWLLTLAGYHTGEGNVQRAIRYNARRNLPIHFWSLPLAPETHCYVPRLLALSAIIQDPEKYNFKLPNINNQPYLAEVQVHAGISIIHVAELANISLKALKAVNPGFKQLIFVPNKPYRLLLPAKYVSTFKSNLAQLPRKDFYSKLFYYTVKSGDNLIKIARRYNLKVEQLCLWNELNPKKVLPLKKKLIIKLPPTAFALGLDQIYHPNVLDPNLQHYTVRQGDTLWGIAKQLNLKITDLKQWNNLPANIIKPGQKLTIKIRKHKIQTTSKKHATQKTLSKP